MNLIEKLFIGFWIWHSGEWFYSVFIRGKKNDKLQNEINETSKIRSEKEWALQFERQETEIKLFKSRLIKAELELHIFKFKNKKQIEKLTESIK